MRTHPSKPRLSVRSNGRVAAIACGLTGLIWFAAATALADDVRIVRHDGTTIEGRLKTFEDGVYVIGTPTGDVSVEVSKVATIDVTAVPKPVAASPPHPMTPPLDTPKPPDGKPNGANGGLVAVTTTSKIQHVGRITSFEDGIYEIETPAGLQRIPVANVLRIEPANGNTASPATTVAHDQLPVDLTGEGLSFSGSRTLGELVVRQLIETYAQQGRATNPVWTQRGSQFERSFQAQAGGGKTFTATISLKGTQGGIEDLIRGSAGIAMLERRMQPAEAQRVVDAGLGDPLSPANETIIGPSAVVVIVHPSNPVKGLTFAQVSGIFSGRIRNWTEVGGPNRRIQVLAPQHGSSLIDVATTSIANGFEISGSARRVGSSLEAADLVGADPAAIALSHTDYRGNTSALSLSNGCGMTFEPNAFQIESETYPLWSRLVLYTTDKASRQTRDFLAFAQSTPTQQILRERGLGSLTPVVAAKGAIKFDRAQASGIADVSPRFVEVVAGFVDNAARTSVTFRFDAGSDRLDGRATGDVERLVDFIKSGALANRKLALVGYWENTGNFASDVAQSKSRAVAVSEVLQKKGLSIERLFGFGPLLPVECDGAPTSVQRNRRVEVWVE